MKAIVSNELKKRLECASKNGSVIATDILRELKKDKNEIFGDKNVDYFDSVRIVNSRTDYKGLKIYVSVCTKDLNNPNFPDRGNPQAPYFRENRERINLGTFLNLFKTLSHSSYSTEECSYFESAMCVCDVVKYRLCSKMEDFERAYNMNNYYPFGQNESPLHSSCMRYEDTARNAADFYVNFAGAKILVAEDSQGQILGRAIVWDKVDIANVVCESLSLLDRIYFNFDFIRQGLLTYAKDVLKINLRKTHNSVGTTQNFTACNFEDSGDYTWRAVVRVPKVQWHKKGAPYLDTFPFLNKTDDGFVLANYQTCNTIAQLNYTGGYGSLYHYICPVCGELTSGGTFCEKCSNELIERTNLGTYFKCKMRTYKGKKYPEKLFTGKKPSVHFLNWIGIKKITDSTFSI